MIGNICYSENMKKDNNDDENTITAFAVTDYRNRKDVFGIKKKDRRSHMYIIGKTGSGKSTLLKNMLVSDIQRGEGIALIDPHGDLAESILDYVPEERMEEVIYFNPADMQYPFAFNPLEKVKPDFRGRITSDILSVFKKVWPNYWGPRMEHILRYTLLTLLCYPKSTLLDIPRLLTDKPFRQNILKYVEDHHIKDFWLYQIDKISKTVIAETISPILNKIGVLNSSPLIRHVLGQSHSAVDLRQVMDEGKILIVNLSKGKIGEDAGSLFGAMLVSKIMLSAFNRSNVDEAQRRVFHLYVDEVHNYLTPAFSNILSESRKYGLDLVLAHQYIDQLDSEVRSAIVGNVGTIISFRTGAEDAQYLVKEFTPVFDQSDLIRLPNYSIYIKLMIDGTTSLPFSAKTLPPPKPGLTLKPEIIEFSRVKYGRPRDEVEEEMLRRRKII